MKDYLVFSIICLLSAPLFASAQDEAASSDSPTLTVALVSPRCVFGDVDANLAHFATLIEQAQAKGARLICFPELALVSYSTHKNVLKSAESIPGPTTKELETIAKRLDVDFARPTTHRPHR